MAKSVYATLRVYFVAAEIIIGHDIYMDIIDNLRPPLTILSNKPHYVRLAILDKH